MWVAGVADVHDPFVWAACARFAALPEDVAQRVSAPGGGGAFLVLVYDAPPEARRAVPQLVERGGGLGAPQLGKPASSDGPAGCWAALRTAEERPSLLRRHEGLPTLDFFPLCHTQVPKLLEVTPRVEGPSHLLTARALDVQMPLGSAAAVRCDLVATSSEPLSRLLGAGAPEGEHSIVAPPCLPVVQSAPRAAPPPPPPPQPPPPQPQPQPQPPKLRLPRKSPCPCPRHRSYLRACWRCCNSCTGRWRR